MPCTKGASNTLNRYCVRRRETRKASQQTESSDPPITATAGCIGDKDLLTLCKRYNAFGGGGGVKTS